MSSDGCLSMGGGLSAADTNTAAEMSSNGWLSMAGM